MTRYSFAGTETIWRVVVHIPEFEYEKPIWNHKVTPSVIDHYETVHVREQTVSYGPYANKTPAKQVRNKERKRYAESPAYKDSGFTVELEEATPNWRKIDG